MLHSFERLVLCEHIWIMMFQLSIDLRSPVLRILASRKVSWSSETSWSDNQNTTKVAVPVWIVGLTISGCSVYGFPHWECVWKMFFLYCHLPGLWASDVSEHFVFYGEHRFVVCDGSWRTSQEFWFQFRKWSMEKKKCFNIDYKVLRIVCDSHCCWSTRETRATLSMRNWWWRAVVVNIDHLYNYIGFRNFALV